MLIILLSCSFHLTKCELCSGWESLTVVLHLFESLWCRKHSKKCSRVPKWKSRTPYSRNHFDHLQNISKCQSTKYRNELCVRKAKWIRLFCGELARNHAAMVKAKLIFQWQRTLFILLSWRRRRIRVSFSRAVITACKRESKSSAYSMQNT